MAMVVIDAKRFDALIFDLDGVITQTASVHARAWKQLFDEFLARRAARTGAAFVPFDVENDYRLYVDGKPRIAGVLSFLASREINIPLREPGGSAERETVQGLATRKDRYFAELLSREGVRASASAESLLRNARERGMSTAIASSSHHCREILHSTGLAAYFDVRVDGIDLDRLGLPGKPAPDMFLEAARRLNVQPMRAAVFEDATVGIVAARAGGFGLVVGVGSAARAPDLLKHGADGVVINLDEVRLEGTVRLVR